MVLVHFLIPKQATQATTSKNLKYETSQQKAALLIKQIGCNKLNNHGLLQKFTTAFLTFL